MLKLAKTKKKLRNIPREINFLGKVRWLFSNNPKHELNKKLSHLNQRKKEIKLMQKQLKKNVDNLHNHTIKLASLQKHIFTNHEETLEELKQLKEFKKEKQEIEKVLISLHNLLGHIPDKVADDFVKSKDFSLFEKVMSKHFKDYSYR